MSKLITNSGTETNIATDRNAKNMNIKSVEVNKSDFKDGSFHY